MLNAGACYCGAGKRFCAVGIGYASRIPGNSGCPRRQPHLRPTPVLETSSSLRKSASSIGSDDIPVSMAWRRANRCRSARDRRGRNGAEQARPGFTYTESAFATPVFTLRGVGFYDTSLAASPSVSVYVDEVPAARFQWSPAERRLTCNGSKSSRDLKGPCFGQNSTGGAINYIAAAKPTQDLEVGLTAGYERFGKFSAQGLSSGPISDTLSPVWP